MKTTLMISITLVLAAADIFCLLLSTTFALLTFAAASWYYREPRVHAADAMPPTTPSTVSPIANHALPPVVTSMPTNIPVTLHG